MFPNSFFDATIAHKLWQMYFDEMQYSVESGFDGLMINEHHNTPLSMSVSISVIGGILARLSTTAKIVYLGNVLPIHDNPLRLAEEIALVDVISGGRVISGFVRGIGYESLSTTINPVYNKERFEEAHDLIIKAWTIPGPFRWEGNHYQFRAVNPWVLPLQKPHPPIWIPGSNSPESIRYAAKRRYPYIIMAPRFDLLEEIYELHRIAALGEGYETTPDHRGYAVRVFVSDNDQLAYEEGKKFYWQQGTSFGTGPKHWTLPVGYLSREAANSRRVKEREVVKTGSTSKLSYEEAQSTYQIITGTPDTVIQKLKHVVDAVDPANLILWPREGPITHQSAVRCIDLLCQEVIPAIKEYEPQHAA